MIIKVHNKSKNEIKGIPEEKKQKEAHFSALSRRSSGETKSGWDPCFLVLSSLFSANQTR